jgi:hypothetical protein
MKMAVLCGVVCVVLAGAAQADIINFEGDASGAKPNGWSSNDSPLVHFSDSNGNGLDLEDWGEQGLGKSLLVGDDWDGSGLVMDFDVQVNALSLAFGNDDAGWTNAGDQAILTAFLHGTQVGQETVVMNRNDVMDQIISISGIEFDSATFYYAATGQSNGLQEIVDDINFEVAAVPLPGAVLLGALGLGTAGWLTRRRTA